MKIKREIIIVVLVLLATTLVGCGTQLKELSIDQEERVVVAAAQFIGNYNINQDHAYTPLSQESATEVLQREADIQARLGGVDVSAGNTEEGQDNLTPLDIENEESQQEISTSKQLGEILGLTDITISYKGAELITSYPGISSYEVSPESTDRLLKLKFELSNNSNENREISLVAKYPYQVELSTGKKATALVTLLEDDLATYDKIVAPNRTEEVILLFEVNEEDSGNLDELQLKVDIGSGFIAVPIK